MRFTIPAAVVLCSSLLGGCVSVTVTASTCPSCQEPAPEGFRIERRTMELDGQTYAWAIMTPLPAPEGPAPGLLFLHGSGECGTDGEKALRVGLPPAILRHAERWPFVVIVPQKPTSECEWEDHERAVLAMLDQAAGEGLIDPERVAITGLSQGGHGTVSIASEHPGRFRAAAPVCGYVDRRFSEDHQRLGDAGATPDDPGVLKAADALRRTPVWLFHGAEDSVVPVSESRSLYAALKAIGADCRYSEVPGYNHNVWDPAYDDPELAAWLHARTRTCER